MASMKEKNESAWSSMHSTHSSTNGMWWRKSRRPVRTRI